MGVHLTQAKATVMGGAAVVGAAISELFGGWDATIMKAIEQLQGKKEA